MRAAAAREDRLDLKTILVTESASIRTITLHRPERRNAMTPEMQTELISALEDIASSDCRVLVLAGAGDAFCSGLDLSALHAIEDRSAAEHRADAERIARLFLALNELPIPTIAAVHGPAIAGGAGLAFICDFTLATPAAKFGFTEVRIGFVPALVSAFLALQVAGKKSRDLLLTGRLCDAEEAYRLGLVNEIVAPERLTDRVQALADVLIANSPQALKATKSLLAQQNRAWLDSAVAQALEANAASRETADFREGITAFLEKRKPAWGKGSRAKPLRH
jgi:methylglutaconyl-CoA hydratase